MIGGGCGSCAFYLCDYKDSRNQIEGRADGIHSIFVRGTFLLRWPNNHLLDDEPNILLCQNECF